MLKLVLQFLMNTTKMHLSFWFLWEEGSKIRYDHNESQIVMTLHSLSYHFSSQYFFHKKESSSEFYAIFGQKIENRLVESRETKEYFNENMKNCVLQGQFKFM